LKGLIVSYQRGTLRIKGEEEKGKAHGVYYTTLTPKPRKRTRKEPEKGLGLQLVASPG